MEPLSPAIFKKKKSLKLVTEDEEDMSSTQEKKLENAFLSPRPQHHYSPTTYRNADEDIHDNNIQWNWDRNLNRLC